MAKISKSAAIQLSLIGDKKLRRKIERMGKASGKIARKGINKRLQVTTKAIKKEVPSHMKSIRKAVGHRNKKHPRKYFHQAISGINVGKKGEKRAPHGPIIILGTKERFHKDGKSVGRVRGDDFVKRGARKSRQQAAAEERRAIKAAIQAEARKS